MKAEDEPITADEFVLRLIWKAFFKGSDPTVISPKAFLPKPNETDGISVFREACVRDSEDVLGVIAEPKRNLYGIVRIPVAHLARMGLSVVPAKIDLVPGHAVLPELNIAAFKADPAAGEEIQEALAGIAKVNVIRKPL